MAGAATGCPEPVPQSPWPPPGRPGPHAPAAHRAVYPKSPASSVDPPSAPAVPAAGDRRRCRGGMSICPAPPPDHSLPCRTRRPPAKSNWAPPPPLPPLTVIATGQHIIRRPDRGLRIGPAPAPAPPAHPSRYSLRKKPGNPPPLPLQRPVPPPHLPASVQVPEAAPPPGRIPAPAETPGPPAESPGSALSIDRLGYSPT